MNTLIRYMELRRGIIPTGNITETRIYELYRRYAIEQDGYALSFEAVRPYLRSEIWQIRVWWAGNMGFMVEQQLYVLLKE